MFKIYIETTENNERRIYMLNVVSKKLTAMRMATKFLKERKFNKGYTAYIINNKNSKILVRTCYRHRLAPWDKDYPGFFDERVSPSIYNI